MAAPLRDTPLLYPTLPSSADDTASSLEDLFDTLKQGPRSRGPDPPLDGDSENGLEGESEAMSSRAARLETELQKARQSELGGEDDENPPDSGVTGNAAPLYEMRLHPKDRKLLLDKAPSPEARAAWLKGTAVDRRNRCRLLLVKSDAALEGEWEGVSCTSSEELYKEGRDWWERYAGM